MENQEKTKIDSLNLKKTQEVDGEEIMTAEEWLDYSNELMEIMGATRDYSDAGKCFVMPYRMKKK
jgi:hypothetical protein